MSDENIPVPGYPWICRPLNKILFGNKAKFNAEYKLSFHRSY